MKLIVIEGVDGSGKSTQIGLLQSHFAREGYDCRYLHFPRTDAPYFGELIARFLRGEFGSLKDLDPYLVAMLYAGDRKDAAEIIQGWLRENKIVLLDRYTYSNIAYQCAKLSGRDERIKLKEWILRLEFEHFAIPKPDLNIFLDAPLSFTSHKLSGDRKGNDREYLKGNRDVHEESYHFQEKVREIYLELSENEESFTAVTCSDKNGNMLTPEEISEMIISIINERIRF